MGKFESLTWIITGAVMLLSLFILLLFTFHRIAEPEAFEMSAAYIGIPLMLLAATADGFHWRNVAWPSRNQHLSWKPSGVSGGQRPFPTT